MRAPFLCFFDRFRLRAASFACPVTINDAALGKVVRRHFEIDAVAQKNLDAMTAEPPGKVGEHRVPVFQLDREGRAGVDLSYGPKDLEGCLFHRLSRAGSVVLWRAISTAAGYDRPTFTQSMWASIAQSPDFA